MMRDETARLLNEKCKCGDRRLYHGNQSIVRSIHGDDLKLLATHGECSIGGCPCIKFTWASSMVISLYEDRT